MIETWYQLWRIDKASLHFKILWKRCADMSEVSHTHFNFVSYDGIWSIAFTTFELMRKKATLTKNPINLRDNKKMSIILVCSWLLLLIWSLSMNVVLIEAKKWMKKSFFLIMKQFSFEFRNYFAERKKTIFHAMNWM